MKINSINEITQAIKNFDIAALKELLDDNKPYQDVPKSLFLEKLEKKFNQARRDDCHSFDDVFFGICESCNKGCEGMTFLSNSGYYLDLFIESKDEEFADDIYVCNKLTNFTDLEKSIDLGFSFRKDEYYNFKPTSKYLIIKKEYNELLNQISEIEKPIKVDKLLNWYYNNFNYLSETINGFGPFECFDYNLYNDAYSLVSKVERVFEITQVKEQAIESLVDYHNSSTERERLIWFFKNQENLYGSIYFEFSEKWKTDSIIFYEQEQVELELDITGYEYVIDYFLILDNLYDELIEKYKPIPVHFEGSKNGSIECSLENYLRLRNKYIDVVKKYGRKGY
ncbi:hypothetical protein Celly_2377 [Cellulophaga lytica DSM 7489]|uniref:Uncharacterized protein n=1 Tax=Cellulophaga lytica (strain ATCC 23178 / DSM 7489 / JCM 8516 / NBRC 14961 / NCIMB 1423 / VKM B-1433 / Cy l20) TaxID=867900 RepID=F0RGZ0_CELLC|nr:hypothetical protein [Cellulophaga lytica]ADY30194.1 hypothetical protein Celly_2377 [Cellulophaga lytica DSM 7489]WQG78870.1 hypothetical protein SR888_08055 [Cellulophaga lytica]